jgi:hypothetical protein
VPERLGGWLTTRSVCDSCNHYFGYTVDIASDEKLLASLRYEVGLGPRPPLEGESFDPDVEAVRRVRVRADGTIEPISPVFEYPDGRGELIRADTREETLCIARKRKASRAARGIAISYREIAEQTDARFVQVAVPVETEDRERAQLLDREAAKIAIEYIALVAHPTLALVPQLDPIRSYARHGIDKPDVATIYLGPEQVWLPRSRHLFFIGGPGDESPAHGRLDELAAQLVPIPSDGSPPRPNDVPDWPGYKHRLALQTDDGAAWFELVLFDCIVSRVVLPRSLTLPWGCFNSKQLLDGTSEAHHPWSSGPIAIP